MKKIISSTVLDTPANKKYELVGPADNEGLRQIRALRDILPRESQMGMLVKAGELGGWIANENCLSHAGECWVHTLAKVYDFAEISDDAKVLGYTKIRGRAQVRGKAQVSGFAQVSDNAIVEDDANVGQNARIYGNASLTDNVVVSGEAQVYGNATLTNNASIGGYAKVYGESTVQGRSIVFDNAEIYGRANVMDRSRVDGCAKVGGKANLYGDSHVRGDAVVEQPNACIVLGPLGEYQRQITCTASNGYVAAGCFHGDLESFRKAVRNKYAAGSDYETACDFLEIWVQKWQDKTKGGYVTFDPAKGVGQGID